MNAEANIYFLSENGDDSLLGSSEATAWASWEHAVATLEAGDTLVVMPGEYTINTDSLELADLSSVSNPTQILSQEPGNAILKPLSLLEGNWEEFEPDLYRQTFEEGQDIACAFLGEQYLHNYRFLADLRVGRNLTSGYHQGGVYYDGPPYGLAYDETYLYMKLPEGMTPEGLQLVHSDRPLVSIQNSPGLVFDGFTLQGCSAAIMVDEQSPFVTIRNCIIRGATYGVLTDADSTLIEWCEYTVPGLTAFNEDLMSLGTYIYYFMKDRGLEGGLAYSTKVPAPRYMESRYNYIHGVFEGDGLGQFDDSMIHHNRYHNCFDNAVELEPNVKGKTAANLHFFQNRVSGYSRGYISHQQNGQIREYAELGNWLMVGPHYVHHNVIVVEGHNHSTGWTPWTVLKTRPWSNTKIIYAHNLIYARTSANLFWYDSEWEVGLAHMELYNNVLILQFGNTAQPIPFSANGNVLRGAAPNPALTGDNGLYLTSMTLFHYTNNSPHIYPQPHSGSILANVTTVDLNEPWMQGLQNEVPGPFILGDDITPEWPRPADRAFAPE